MTDRNLFLLRMSKFPDENFMFSEPAVKKLAEKMKSAYEKGDHVFELILSMTVIEEEGGESVIDWAQKELNKN